MNYLPFSQVATGNIFCLADRPKVSLLKTGRNSAVRLEGYWDGDQLHPRGELVACDDNSCTVAPESSEVTLSVVKEDPIDPRRRFWKDGDTLKVGRNMQGRVYVFAGLYMYSGFGTGTYYSKVQNERFNVDVEDGQRMAQNEGLPFVYFDHVNWTNDPYLTRECTEAHRIWKERNPGKVPAVNMADA